MPEPVRVTVHPGEDVLLPAGTALMDLRGPLADLLRRPELRHAALSVGDVELVPGTVAGEGPLVAGATVRVGAGGVGRSGAGAWSSDDGGVLRAPWVVTRATGADAGSLAPLVPGSPLVLGEGLRARATGRGAVRVRATWGSPQAVLRRPGARRRLVGIVSRRWNPGDVLEAGATLRLYRGGELGSWLLPDQAVPEASARIGATVVASALPALGGVGLAVALRQPTYALFSLMGLVATVPQVLAALRGRRGTAPALPVRRSREAPSGIADPARLALHSLAAVHASDGVWRRARGAVAAGSGSGAASAAAAADAAGAVPDGMLDDGPLAVRGRPDIARAATRAVVAELVARGSSVQVAGGGRGEWAWCRWLDVGQPSPGRQAFVADLPAPADLDRANAARVAGEAVVLVLPPGAPVPPWCRTVIDVDPGEPAQGAGARRTILTVAAERPDRHHTVPRARLASPGGASVLTSLVGVTSAWAEQFARRVAAARALGRDVVVRPATGTGPGEDDPADPRLPAVVPLASLTGAFTAWPSAPDWAVPLGVDAAGRTVRFDLVADGPHLLVAGTTGAGKSELLQALVLALATQCSPRDLALALVDFKGGASFGACVGLPHVVGQVSDLDAALAARALEGLRAELHRRKSVLAEHAAADVAALPPGTLPRLVVVVDEFRALADDLPELLPGLLRVAAQGRSLGVHLVLATQRPAGAVSADVRANVSARLALRVVDAADSHDVLDCAAAARIPAGVPGRAVLRVGAAAPAALQCAYAGAPGRSEPTDVRRAPAWSDEPIGPVLPDTASDNVAATVAILAAAAEGEPRWPAPWLPPLPSTVTAADVDPTPLGTLPLALGDLPSAQARTTVAWDPVTGHLAVLGRARSGRTTALVTLAHAALARGWHVHALAAPAARQRLAALAPHPGFGTLAGPDDPRRAARLLRLLARDPGGPPTLVLVDGVEELRAALVTPTQDPLAAALATAPAAFAMSAESASVGGLAARCGVRLALLSGDSAADAMLGVPSPFAGRGRAPGRAVWLAGGGPVECQVLLPPKEPPLALETRAEPPRRILTLPHHVLLAGLGAPAPGMSPTIGVGGDDAAPVRLDVAAGALVVGPRGSGRTAALRVLLHGLAAGMSREEIAVVTRDRDLRADADRLEVTVVPPTPSALDALAREAEPRVVLIDDADVVAQTYPLETDRLAERCTDGTLAVVATATTLAASLAHRGLLAHLRGGRTGIVLAAGERGSDEVFGTSLVDAAEPGVQLPGRGALVVDGQVRPVQLADPAGREVSSASWPRPRAA
ncbi:MAG: FtsK/SpoIIIE domain-containing protein [Promicromonosporaceae bacterium]|nr:FtsK/SpoIIIE domain-containing protein [Promicromonosporaceae bacterium]